MMNKFSSLQLKLLADFFANLAVVWLSAAFIASKDALLTLQSGISDFTSLLIGIMIIKEAEQK